MKSPLTRAPDPRSPQALAPTSCDAARVIFPFNLLLRAPEPDDTSCARAGAESHSGCENPIEDGTPFDMWELARSWTPGFCASGGSRTCAKKECAPDVVDPSLTLHGMWPSFSKPVDASDAGSTRKLSSRETSAALASRGGGGGCFWPQNCAQPPWWPPTAPWGYDPALLPTDETSAALAPAWYDDDLGAHEWSKHGTCAAWSDANGAERGLDQEAYYDAMFELAKKEGTPEMLRNATGSSVSLKSLQDMFGGAGKVALGCTPKCELAQVVTCYSRGGEHGGPGERVDCPCFGVRDSHYDNSCAELHACEDVKVLSAAQTGCGGGGPPRPGPGPGPGPHHRTCRDGARCCPGVRGPTCESDADCETQSGCRRCSHSSSGGHRHCTVVKGE